MKKGLYNEYDLIETVIVHTPNIEHNAVTPLNLNPMDKQKYLEENFEKMQGWVGKIATFKYFERTKAGSYRHPLFKCIRDYE